MWEQSLRAVMTSVANMEGNRRCQNTVQLSLKVATNAVYSWVFYHLTGDLYSATLLRKK